MASDVVQRVREAIVGILDTKAAIVALTGRANRNVLPFQKLADATVPVLAYFVVTANNAGGIGDTRRVVVQFTAAAVSESVANALLEAVENSLTAPAFAALAAPLDAMTESWSRRGEVEVAEDGTFSADLDVSLIVTK